MTIVERLKAARAKKFPEYEQALERVARAEAAHAKSELELKAARNALSQYGDGPRTLEWVTREIAEILGEDV